MAASIKAVLLDSGRVLNGPVTGQWMIPPNFFSFADKRKFNALPAELVVKAFKKGYSYISDQNFITTEEDELTHFLRFYQIMAEELTDLGVSEEQVEMIARDLVFNSEKYRFYKEVPRELALLGKQFKLAVVSDAWPSLETVFIQAGLRDCFDSFIISSQLGVTKPHKKMYETALAELGISADEAVFVDDNPQNCDGAIAAGIERTYLLCRSLPGYFSQKRRRNPRYHVIRNLKQLRKDLFLRL